MYGALTVALLTFTLPPLMDHPYMDPNDCPWTEEYQENWRLRKRYNMVTMECDDDDDNEQEDALFNL